MKKLLIPVIVAVLAGVGGGSGFAYRSASHAYTADSTHYADSVAANPPADSAAVDEHGAPVASAESHDAASTPTGHDEDVPATPADSLRAIAASRAATKGAKADSHTPDVAAGHEPAGASASKVEEKHTTPTVDANAKASTAAVAAVVRNARNEAMSTALPEQRLAKIFAAMSAKDAAKVLDQMADSDIRDILSLMNDRAAAAILVQFAPARAAAITKGGGKPVNHEPGHVP